MKHHTNHQWEENVPCLFASKDDTIPTYVELSSLIVILAPSYTHRERGEVCNYLSWRSRGWCRLELQSALLASHDLAMMVCEGNTRGPYMLSSFDAWNMPACAGAFTCCALDHSVGGRQIECDKVRVGRVLHSLIDGRGKYLEASGQRRQWLRLNCLRHWLQRGLPDSAAPPERRHSWSCIAGVQLGSSLENFKAELKWTDADDAAQSDTGRTLLHCAVRANNVRAVRDLLLQGVGKEADVVLKDADEACGERSTNPVIEAMMHASPEVVEALLDAGFDHMARTPQGNDAFYSGWQY